MTLKTRLSAIARRDVLLGMLDFAWVAPLAAGLWGLARFLRYEPPTTGGTQFILGSPTALPRLPAYIEAGQVWLHQDSAGYYAVDAICTHLGCTVRLQPDGQEFLCPCHGSRFLDDGAVVNGPATQPLRFLKLYWNNQHLIVNRAEVVEPSARLSPS
jgi:Rieske Fe-S protein